MSIWMCQRCHSLQGFSKEMRCLLCGGSVSFAHVHPGAVTNEEETEETPEVQTPQRTVGLRAVRGDDSVLPQLSEDRQAMAGAVVPRLPPEPAIDQARRGLETIPCLCCEWPMSYEVLNLNLICPCCGFEPECDLKSSVGVDGYRADWDRRWWCVGEAPPMIVRELQAQLTACTAAREAAQQELKDVRIELDKMENAWDAASDRDLEGRSKVREAEAELVSLRTQLEKMRARAIVAEHHKVLSCLGKSSYQEVVEDKLRVELAEAQLLCEQQAEDIMGLKERLAELREDL